MGAENERATSALHAAGLPATAREALHAAMTGHTPGAPVRGASKDPVKIAAEMILLERGYSRDEAVAGVSFYKNGMPVSRQQIRWLVSAAKDHIDHIRDDMRVGTDFYRGIAYFWGYKYRFWMRGDAHGNGYKDIPIEKARRQIHQRFCDERLELAGETSRHDEIINGVFGMHEYTQEEA